MKSLSVVVPTLNCIELLRGHVASMRKWWHLADEVIVVDSFSDDGCADFARQEMEHPGLRVLSHPRGLYQSWNHGIAQTSGDWVYVSTVGDDIEAAQIEALMNAGNALDADVVLSVPRFVTNEGAAVASLGWPVERLVAECLRRREVSRLPFAAALILSLRHLPMSVLGSSASNLYRGEHLRVRPFPTDFAMIGDVAWGLRHLAETRFAVVATSGSTFRLHPKVYAPLSEARLERLSEALRREAEIMLAGPLSDASRTDAAQLAAIHAHYFEVVPEAKEARAAYGLARREGGGRWWLRKEGWAARARKGRTGSESARGERGMRALLRDLMNAEEPR